MSEVETTISDEVATAHVPILANTLKIGYFFHPNIRDAPQLSGGKYQCRIAVLKGNVNK